MRARVPTLRRARARAARVRAPTCAGARSNASADARDRARTPNAARPSMCRRDQRQSMRVVPPSSRPGLARACGAPPRARKLGARVRKARCAVPVPRTTGPPARAATPMFFVKGSLTEIGQLAADFRAGHRIPKLPILSGAGSPPRNRAARFPFSGTWIASRNRAARCLFRPRDPSSEIGQLAAHFRAGRSSPIGQRCSSWATDRSAAAQLAPSSSPSDRSAPRRPFSRGCLVGKGWLLVVARSNPRRLGRRPPLLGSARLPRKDVYHRLIERKGSARPRDADPRNRRLPCASEQ